MFNVLSILLALVILGICVMIHEFGHYIVGKKSGIGVIEFAVGMGPKLFGWERNGTKYSLRLIPLGGYCAFVGEDEDNSDPRAMNNQPVWKRFLTVFAGPFMNFVLAFVLAGVLLQSGQIVDIENSFTHPVLDVVDAGMPAGKAGLQVNDAIVALDGVPIEQNDAGVEKLREIITASESGKTLVFTVQRNGETIDVPVTPEYSEADGKNMVGVVFRTEYAVYDLGFFAAVPEALSLMGQTVVQTFAFLKDLIWRLLRGLGIESGSVSGVVGIVSNVSSGIQAGFQDTFSSGIYSILVWLLNISLSLGIMNLLPVPALDGGRMLFLLVEAIRRKPVNREREAMVNLIGFALLIFLMIVITVSDVRGLIG